MSRRTVIAVAIALVLVCGAWYVSYGGFPVFWHGQRLIPTGSNSISLGRDDAPVTVVEYADFQCPSCATFHFGAGAAIIEQYVKRGVVKMVYRDFPLLGQESFDAAYAARCAREQGKYDAYRDELFEQTSKGAGENSGVFSVQNLMQYAERIGMNKNLFSGCLASGRARDEVATDIAAGSDAGVSGTPTVFVNGEKMEGLYLFAAYQQAIEKALAQ